MSLEAQSLQPKRLRNAPVTILSEILKEKAKLDAGLVTENNAILKAFLDTFIPEMRRQDKLFDLLYSRIYFTGSYYSDLRVSKPDEYDLNLVLKLPFKQASVQYNPQVPSYVKYQVSDEKAILDSGLKKLFKDGYIIPNEVRKWIQGVIDKAHRVYHPPSNVVRLERGASGPAQTIILVKRTRGQIDIDLVPAIQCCLGPKPPGIDGRVYDKVKNNLQCFIVPKPYQKAGQAPINENERLRLWRAHYPDAESKLIHDIGCVKPVIKLLKLLRDKEDWKILASYYLKTVLLWMIINNSNAEYWRLDKLGERFMDALQVLADNVKNRKIPYFFSSRYNLLEKLTPAQAENIHNRLRCIIKDIEKDPSNLWIIFGCKPTFSI